MKAPASDLRSGANHKISAEPPAPPLPPPSPSLDSIVMDWSPITFSGGTPVGGSAHVTVYPNGKAVFSGSMHDSGTPSYGYAVTFALVSTEGSVFTISHTGTLKGTFDPGSRTDAWTEGTTNSELAAAREELSRGYAWSASASVNWKLKQLVANVIDAAKAVAGIGGAVKSVVALVA